MYVVCPPSLLPRLAEGGGLIPAGLSHQAVKRKNAQYQLTFGRLVLPNDLVSPWSVFAYSEAG